jgi:hypothetical protein
METKTKQMETNAKSLAVTNALAHIEAWSNHDWDKSERGLATDVNVTITTTQPIMGPINTTGVKDYMDGLKKFGQGILPGTSKIISSIGDDRNAMIMVTVDCNFGEGVVKLTGSRLYLFDESGKIKSEQVIFFVSTGSQCHV